ncbi:serine/threonine-protein phosphatase 6 regulatory ankyrin repeat subunit C-like [Amphibalanus amphitrite]|uniref:serine/threonine-protein phosphatase 6 regulatory ankyrin repeat subunit C-like n=1 Tax=Amphibalanus amphitrite TaxID=1232801 RepID=UPI001C905409|nr:serine/threonine-protein phosphatase 6 regulatory ankyrin repeat subunit C-like [Amphibalanus amphitrite]
MPIQVLRPSPSPAPEPCLQRALADSITRSAPLDEMRILIACGAKVNAPVTLGLRPLHYAVWQRYPEAARWLLTRGCDVNAADDLGHTALHLCAEKGYAEMVALFLEFGARVDFTELHGGEVDEPLRMAVKHGHLDIARMLLQHGANPNATYFLGPELSLLNPLDLEWAELLLQFGADPNAPDRAGLSQLMRAARQPDGLPAVKLYVQYGGDVNSTAGERHDFRTVLHYAVMSGQRDTVRFLVRSGARVNYPCDYEKPTPLDLAIIKGDVDMVRLLIDLGADVNAHSPIIGSPLHVACSEYIENRSVLLELLLAAGADPNVVVKSEDGYFLRPVLGEYLQSNQQDLSMEVIQLLLQHGTRVVLKSQFRDPMGLLNSLPDLHELAGLYEVLASSADSFDPPILRRSRALSERQREQLLLLARAPRPLLALTRDAIRRAMGRRLRHGAALLELPRELQQFLLYQTV